MAEQLDFSIPERGPKKGGKSSPLLIIITVVILIAVSFNIFLVLTQSERMTAKPGKGQLSLQQKKQLALKLEKQGLNSLAAEAWTDYVSASSLGEEEAAKIWYRIGKLHQDDNDYARALESYYRSESFAQPEEITADIARNIQECLEAMGKFAALRYELAERVGLDTSEDEEKDKQPGDQIVAEIGPQKITKSDLDRQIEMRIDRQLAQLASHLPPDELNKQKENFLKQLSTPGQREIFLNQYVIEEILYRKARELQLAKDPEVHALIKDQERSILASKLLEKEMTDKIKITPGDLNTFYEAHKQKYLQPERAMISIIKAPDEAEAGKVRRDLIEGKDFSLLAINMQTGNPVEKKTDKVSNWIKNTKNSAIPVIGPSEEAMKAIFSTPAGELTAEDIVTDTGVYIIKVIEREAEQQMTFDEAKDQVYRDLRLQKEQEVQQHFLTELKEQYNVVIHLSELSHVEEPAAE